eukprot:TRINITY_DN3226_c0_g1_i1.p1 TRINITY_DN3226_c0_g1~~TRINITY_DN3226_c0_g1_i1.p1  ORF type:complete len:326 (+),score=33.36 TRINITY_DN3226_c0_g1_i1:113-1090(+)
MSQRKIPTIVEYSMTSLSFKEGKYTQSLALPLPNYMDVKYVELHQHIGGLNMTVDHFRNGKYLNTLCAQAPVYVDDYLTNIPTCHYPESYSILTGDSLHITSLYTGRTISGGHAWHSGVMGLVYIAGVADPLPKQVCLNRLHVLCGEPPYPTEISCNQCALKHESDLASFNCTIPMVKKECNKTDTGAMFPTDQVHNMSLKFTPITDFKILITVTAPSGSWFSIAIHPNNTMEGAEAYVHCNDDSGKPALQHRILGNHEPGRIVNKNIPCNVTTTDNEVTLSFFLISTIDEKDPQCFLFAQGSTESMDLDNHGSSRGSTCIQLDQ